MTGRPPTGSNVKVSGSVLFNGERAAKDAGFNITRAYVFDDTSRRSNKISAHHGPCLYPSPRPNKTNKQSTDVACYVEETDNNEPLLTVRETLEFGTSPP